MTNKYECLLQGVIPDSEKEILVEKLRGICYELETPFKHREMIYKSTPVPGNPPNEIRVICNLLESLTSHKRWNLQLLGQPVKSKHPATVRSVIDVKVSDNIEAFMDPFGFKLDYEYIQEGYRSYTVMNDRRFSVTISKIKRRLSDTQTQDIDMFSSTWYVEISTYVTSDEEISQATEETNQLAERFVPIIDLSKIDPKELAKPAAPPASSPKMGAGRGAPLAKPSGQSPTINPRVQM